jgi:hypothetical protein
VDLCDRHLGEIYIGMRSEHRRRLLHAREKAWAIRVKPHDRKDGFNGRLL